MNRRICHRVGHRRAECTQNTCGNCGQHGHSKTDCPRITCYNCGQGGHIASRCPEENRFRMEICWTCGDPNHIRTSRLCPGNPLPDNWFCSYCLTKGTSTAKCPCNKVTEIQEKKVKRNENIEDTPENPAKVTEDAVDINSNVSVIEEEVSDVDYEEEEWSDTNESIAASHRNPDWFWAINIGIGKENYVAPICPKVGMSTLNPRRVNFKINMEHVRVDESGDHIFLTTTIHQRTRKLEYMIQYGNTRGIVLGFNAIKRFRLQASVYAVQTLPDTFPWHTEDDEAKEDGLNEEAAEGK